MRGCDMLPQTGVARMLRGAPLCFTAGAREGRSPPVPAAVARTRAASRLQRQSGAAVSMQVGETGATRVLTLGPGAAWAARDLDPAAAALRFLVEQRELFALDDSAAAAFTVGRVDRDPGSDVRHVTLQRLIDGDPVFQGAIRVQLNRHNEVPGARGDDFYRAAPPRNRKRLTAIEAAVAAGGAFGIADLGRLVESAHVTPMVLSLAADDSRF